MLQAEEPTWLKVPRPEDRPVGRQRTRTVWPGLERARQDLSCEAAGAAHGPEARSSESNWKPREDFQCPLASLEMSLKEELVCHLQDVQEST